MSLIKCPECGKEISNKASACTHCGYPLEKPQIHSAEKYICIYKNKQHDLSELVNYLKDYTFGGCDNAELKPEILYKAREILNKHMSIDSISGDELIYYIKTFRSVPDDEFIPTGNIQQYIYSTPQPSTSTPTNQVHCPKCGSTSITTEEVGYGLFGWIGASQKKNLCQKCGYKWWPGR